MRNFVAYIIPSCRESVQHFSAGSRSFDPDIDFYFNICYKYW